MNVVNSFIVSWLNVPAKLDFIFAIKIGYDITKQ